MTDLSEEWRPIPGTDGVYCASNLGRVKRLDHVAASGLHLRERILTATPIGGGHLQVGIFGRLRTVHSLVLLAFVGPRPPGLVIRHLDDNPANNRLSNIVYGTQVENMADIKHRSGVCRHRAARLKAIIARRPAWTYAELEEVAREHDICSDAILRLYRGQTYRDVLPAAHV